MQDTHFKQSILNNLSSTGSAFCRKLENVSDFFVTSPAYFQNEGIKMTIPNVANISRILSPVTKNLPNTVLEKYCYSFKIFNCNNNYLHSQILYFNQKLLPFFKKIQKINNVADNI